MTSKPSRSGRAAALAKGPSTALATGAVLAVAALAGCGSASGTPTAAQRFVDAVDAAGASGDPMSMTSVTHFDWDHGIFVCPADTGAQVAGELGAAWPQASEREDSAAYAVFASADDVVDTLPLDRDIADPCAGDPPLASRTFGPASDFRVEPAAVGDGWAMTRIG